MLVQVGGVVTLFGAIDTSGGTGSRWDLAPTLPMASSGGDGAVGLVRLEMPTNPGVGALGTTIPPATAKNVDVLRDRDLVVGARSLWYSTRQAFPPAWLRYVVEAEVGGIPRTFSDDPAQGTYAGYGSGEPITVLVQGVTVSPAAGTVLSGSERAWRDRVGPGVGQSLAGDGCNGVRFLILFDKRLSTSVRVKKVQLGFREQP